LDIKQVCFTFPSYDFEQLAPFWTCFREAPTSTNYISDWTNVATEFWIPGVGRVDVALLKRKPDTKQISVPTKITSANGKTKKVTVKKHHEMLKKLIRDNSKNFDIIGAVEVFATSKMTQSKVDQMTKLKIPFVEVNAWRHIPRNWQKANPLMAIRTHEGVHKCDMCQNMQTDFVWKSVASIVDLYLTPTSNGFNRMSRHVFCVWERQSDKHLVLTEMKTRIVVKRHFETSRPRYVFDAPDMQSLKSGFDDFLKFCERDSNVLIVDQHNLPWPGVDINKFLGGEYIPISERRKRAGVTTPFLVRKELEKFGNHPMKFDYEKSDWIVKETYKKKKNFDAQKSQNGTLFLTSKPIPAAEVVVVGKKNVVVKKNGAKKAKEKQSEKNQYLK